MDNDHFSYYKLYKQKTHFLLYKNVYPFVLLYILYFVLFANAYLSQNLEKEFYSYTYRTFKLDILVRQVFTAAFVFLVFLQIFLFLLMLWSQSVKCFMQFSSVKDISEATNVFVKAKDHCGPSEICELKPLVIDGAETLTFVFQKIKFVLDKTKNSFRSVDYPTNNSIQFYIEQKGIKENEISNLRKKYGTNEFEIPNITFLRLFIEHISAPFFVFQIFVVILWSLDGYYTHSALIVVMLFGVEAAMVKKRLKNLSDIRQMRFPAVPVNVLRSGVWKKISSFELLPGDVMLIPESEKFAAPSDLIVLNGQCVVNESLLTGESIPHVKDSIDQEDDKEKLLDLKVMHSRHLVSSGTFVLSSKRNASNNLSYPPPPTKQAIGYVVQTSYSTNQGKLLRTILYSTEKTSASDDKEALKFISLLVTISAISAFYVFYQKMTDPDLDIYDLILNCIMIVTMVIPTELPMVLSFAISNSIVNLSKKQVYCLEGPRVPMAGSIDFCFFDKTGTLTTNEFSLEKICRPQSNDYVDTSNLSQPSTLVIAGCHSLSFVNGVSGDPIEVCAFTALKLKFGSDDLISFRNEKSMINNDSKIRIVKRFPFSSSERMMSCIIETLPSRKLYYVAKGAAEKIKTIIRDESSSYDKLLFENSKNGYRVLAIAFKKLKPSEQNLKKQDLNQNLIFEGFLLFKCPLRQDAIESIQILHKSNHKTIMITGDNVLTANCIAAEARITNRKILTLAFSTKNDSLVWMKDEIEIEKFSKSLALETKQNCDLSITGDVFDFLKITTDNRELEDLILHFKVFARMNPQQKEEVLRSFKKQNFYVLMCGDGTNDLGALKQAHVGIALTEGDNLGRKEKKSPLKGKEKKLKEILMEEDELHINMNVASIASPFTARNGRIKSVIELIRQGRCALVVNAQMYTILALNCLIHTFVFSYMYIHNLKQTDTQATVAEMIVSAFFFYVSSSPPLEELCAKKPRRKVFVFQTFFTIVGQMAIHISILFLAMHTSQHHQTELLPARDIPLVIPNAHFRPRPLSFCYTDLEPKFAPSVQQTLIFFLSITMNIATFVSNYRGRPFLPSIRENVGFFKICVASVLATSALFFNILGDAVEYLELKDLTQYEEDFLMFAGWILLDFVAVYCFAKVSQFLFDEANLTYGRRKEK